MARRTMRTAPGVRLGVLTISATLLVSACGGADSDTGGGGGGGGAASGDLAIGVTADADTLLPWTATQFQAVNVLEQLYGTLTEFDQDLEVVPGLAESWEVSEDGRTVTFTLRGGVTFADGSEFDSADVVSSLERIMDPATAAVAASTLASVESVDAPDATTVVLNLSNPDSGILAGLASTNLAIVSGDDAVDELASAPNGTGPFTFSERTPNQSITLAANESYWGGEPELATIEFRVIPDETSIVSALQSGNLQLATFDDPLVAQTAEGGGVEVAETPQLAYHALMLNSRQAPLDDVNVRLAIQCAIDRQEVIDTAALGEGEVTGPITSPAYRSDPDARPCPEQDVERAEELLAEAGHPEGITFDAIVSQGGYATSVNEAQNLQAQLAEAGITMNIETLESGTYVDRWVAGDFQSAVALNGGRPDPDVMYGRYFTSDGNLNEVAAYSSPRLDELFAEGKATADPEERKAVYQELSEELEANAPWIWLFNGYSYTATAEQLSGFTPMANGSLKYLRDAALS